MNMKYNMRWMLTILLVAFMLVGCGNEKKEVKQNLTTYQLENETDGFAKGTLTVTLPKDTDAVEIAPFWGDENGKLAGYNGLARFKVEGDLTTKEIAENILIPEGATKLLVYTVNKDGVLSEEYMEVNLPEGAASKAFGEPLYEFQVISDIHILSTFEKAYEEYYNNNFVSALCDIAKVSPDSIGVFINGDIADNGLESEYQKMQELHASVEGAPNYYLTVGNHDLYGMFFEDQINLFLKYAKLPDGSNPKSSHFDFWMHDYHFVFLGNDRLVHHNEQTTLTSETLDWLRATLEKERDEKRPIFLFLHQPLYNTVAGSLKGQNGNGVATESEQPLRDVLKDFPEVIMFNSHSHYPLESTQTMHVKNDKLPTIFNTAATAYLYTNYYNANGAKIEKEDGTFYSQGYYVSVYEDKLLVRGREFTTGEWISSAQFFVDLK